jgi:hypothetical protein
MAEAHSCVSQKAGEGVSSQAKENEAEIVGRYYSSFIDKTGSRIDPYFPYREPIVHPLQ